MNSNSAQPQKMAPNDAAAALSMATAISQNLAPKMAPQAPIEPQAENPTQTATPTDQNIQQVEKTITDGIDELKKEIRGSDLKSQIEEIENELKQILGDDTQDGQTAS